MEIPSKQEASRWVGRVLRDKWRIDARIGRGAVGTVFAATHRNNGHRVAIKLLHHEFSRDEDTRARFVQEGYAANQVGHSGVVRVIDDDETDEGMAFLVMELLEGELLEARRVRSGGTLPEWEVYEVADQLLDVLVAAHGKGIIHRDIKPENLFVTLEGRLKVLDFGFAQLKAGSNREHTDSGVLIGTPGFMAPEQATGDRPSIDARTDIWAVGATLFSLLSGESVHVSQSAAESLVAAASRPPRSLATAAPHLPARLVHVADRALLLDKEARWPTASAMQQALRSIPGRRGADLASGRVRSENFKAESAAPDRAYVALEKIEELDEGELVEEGGAPRVVLSPSLSAQARGLSAPPPVPTVRVAAGPRGALRRASVAPAAPAAPAAMARLSTGPSFRPLPTSIQIRTPHAVSPLRSTPSAGRTALPTERPTTPLSVAPRARETTLVGRPPSPVSQVFWFLAVAMISMVIVVIAGQLLLFRDE